MYQETHTSIIYKDKMYQESHTSIIYKDKILPRNTHIYNIQTQNTTKKHTHL